MWSESSSATRPSPSRDSTSSGLLSGPCITAVPLRVRLSTSRNHWLQCGGSLSEPSSAAGHRMTLAEFGEGSPERAVGGAAVRLRRQDDFERRAPEAGLAGIVRTGRDQHGAAVAHVAGDVVEIDDRQHALARIAVEDDELEVVDLLLEQLARREGDQRQLVDRRAVLLLRRAQDGEVDEVDRGVRLEQVAPGALAGMRLARDQQHAQLVAHAVDRDHGAVVDLRQLVVDRRGLDLDDVRAGMGDLHVDGDVAADPDAAAVDLLAVAADRHLRGAGRGALILDLEGDRLALADDAEARRRRPARRGGRARWHGR